MLEKGALMSMMSGSGPTVFGLTAKKSEALRIAGFLRHATRADVFVTRTSGSGTRFV
jgi:4-diphosphocytidyl-2-C-methyl-D-erythritol kinase